MFTQDERSWNQYQRIGRVTFILTNILIVDSKSNTYSKLQVTDTQQTFLVNFTNQPPFWPKTSILFHKLWFSNLKTQALDSF